MMQIFRISQGPKVVSFGKTHRHILWILVPMVVCICSMSLWSQRIVVSEELLLKDDLSYEVIGLDGRTFLFREKGSDFEVRAYDERMQLRWEHTLELEKRSTDLIGVTAGVHVLHVMYGFRHRGDYTIMHRIYAPDMSLLDTVVVHIDEKEYFTPRYTAAISEDKTTVLLYQAEKEDQVSIIVYALDRKEVLMEKVVQTDNASVRRSLRDMAVSNSGDVFVVFDEDRLSDRDRMFNVLRINSRTHEAKMTEVHLGDLVASDLHIAVDDMHSDLTLSGLFSEKPTGKSKGIFIAKVGLDDGQVTLRTVLFDETLLQSIYGKEVSTNKGVSNFAIQDIVLRQDGGALLIAEMAKEYSRRPNMPGRRDFGYPRGGWVDYYYEDLIVFSLHPDGSEHWNAVLHKKQYSQDDDAIYSSYFLFKTPERLRLIFNDEIRQENMVSEYIIRGNGYFHRQSVFSTDYQRLRLRLRDAVQVSYNVCVVPSERNGRLSLVKITFEEKELAERK
jgi:hypothetical protein